MSRLRPVSGRDLVAILKRKGFEVAGIKGSHHKLVHPDGRWTVVPVHGREEIRPKLLAQILRQCGVPWEQLLDLL